MEKKYNVGGNKKLEQLFYMVDNSFVLSDELKKKLRNLAFFIDARGDTEGGNAIDMIEELVKDLKYCRIFSVEFINELCGLYYDALTFKQINRDLHSNTVKTTYEDITDKTLRFKLKLKEDHWGGFKKGDENYFNIRLHCNESGLTRLPIDQRWEIISCELIK